MLKIKEAVIVEGRYDKLKLSNILDALIIETGGFSIYKDKEKLNFIRKLANERGLVILTDSDRSGFQIRHYISSGIAREKIKHIYIPDIQGKEKRKAKPSKEGKLGVEGMSEALLKELFEKAEIISQTAQNSNPVTNFDLFDFGFSGVPDAGIRKKKLLGILNLPKSLSTNSLLSYINSSMTRDEFLSVAQKVR